MVLVNANWTSISIDNLTCISGTCWIGTQLSKASSKFLLLLFSLSINISNLWCLQLLSNWLFLELLPFFGSDGVLDRIRISSSPKLSFVWSLQLHSTPLPSINALDNSKL